MQGGQAAQDGGEQVPKPVTGDSGGDDGPRQTMAVMTEISEMYKEYRRENLS